MALNWDAPPKLHDGSSWTEYPVKVHDGSGWVEVISTVTPTDFEDQDLSMFSGSTSHISITSSALVGNYSLRYSDTTSSATTGVHAESGLPYFPSVGDTFEFYFRVNNYQSWDWFGFVFAGSNWTDPRYADCVELWMRPPENDFRLREYSGGVAQDNHSTSIATYQDTTYRCEVSFGSSTITLDRYHSDGTHQASLSISNTSVPTSGGIGFLQRSRYTGTTQCDWDHINKL